MDKMIVPIGCDHAGYHLKESISRQLNLKGIEVKDVGTYSMERVDYPDFGHAVAQLVIQHSGTIGIVVCGSGNGMNMTANQHRGIRAALCWNTSIAQLARQHNNANIISLPARFITVEEGLAMVDVFLSTPFEGGRHQGRIEKIPLKQKNKC